MDLPGQPRPRTLAGRYAPAPNAGKPDSRTTRDESRPRATAVGGRAARSGIPDGLTILGLSAGHRVRFRHGPAGRWQEGIVTRRERDGSVGVTDRKGAARAIAVERLEVACTGPRGAAGWEPLTARAARSEQLRLL